MILPASASQGLGFQTCTTTHRLNSSCICTFLNIVQTLVTEETFTQFNVFICVFKEKLSPQDQMNRHLTRPPPDYKDQRRNSGSLQSAAQYSGESSSKQIQIIAVGKNKLLKTYSISPAFSTTLDITSAPPFCCFPLNIGHRPHGELGLMAHAVNPALRGGGELGLPVQPVLHSKLEASSD